MNFTRAIKKRKFIKELEGGERVSKWTKNHGIRIPYFNLDGRLAHYTPDFLVEYTDGKQEIVEIKGSHMIDNKITRVKADAAREWCKKRNINYRLIQV